ncbi:Mor transcription activator family protein [Citrobacter freundii]|uniref:Mor transcription activator family protein n=1 Tax=Citrobacter freundii TaxID=546 RepID=UPI003349CAC6
MITREGLYASSDTLGAMGDAIEAFLIGNGYSQQHSYGAANRIVLGISDTLGGCQGYMPKQREGAPKGVCFLHELTESIAQAVETIPYLFTQAETLSPAISECLRKTFSGVNIYIPMGASKNTVDRNAKVLADFYRGASIFELSKKHKRSIQCIYQIIAAERKKNKARRDMKQGQI